MLRVPRAGRAVHLALGGDALDQFAHVSHDGRNSLRAIPQDEAAQFFAEATPRQARGRSARPARAESKSGKHHEQKLAQARALALDDGDIVHRSNRPRGEPSRTTGTALRYTSPPGKDQLLPQTRPGNVGLSSRSAAMRCLTWRRQDHGKGGRAGQQLVVLVAGPGSRNALVAGQIGQHGFEGSRAPAVQRASNAGWVFWASPAMCWAMSARTNDACFSAPRSRPSRPAAATPTRKTTRKRAVCACSSQGFRVRA